MADSYFSDKTNMSSPHPDSMDLGDVLSQPARNVAEQAGNDPGQAIQDLAPAVELADD